MMKQNWKSFSTPNETAIEAARIKSLAEARDAVTEEEGVEALTSDLSPEDKGWYHKATWHRATNRMEDGVYVVTYTFDAPRRAHSHIFGIGDDVMHVRPMKEENRQTMREAMDQIEAVANIRFEEKTGEYDVYKADFRMFRADFKAGKGGGHASGSPGKEIIDIVMDNSHANELSDSLHELLHGLGVSHPYACAGGRYTGGYNSEFSKDTSVMSYNKGIIPTPGLGPFDVAALIYLYGKSKKMAERETVVPHALLTETRFLLNDDPMTLDLRNARPGIISIKDGRLSGYFQTIVPDRQEGDYVKIRTVGDTRIQDVLAGNSTETSLTLKGNELPNRLQGGRQGDDITLVGGGDIATGNNGHDTFILNAESGFDNVITDFVVFEKRIALQPPIARVELCQRDDMPVDGVPQKGTLLFCRDDDGNPVASVFCVGNNPEQIEYHLRQDADHPLQIATVKYAPAAPTAAAPSHGLPDMITAHLNTKCQR